VKRSFNDVTCLKLNFCFKKIKEKLVTKIWTVYFHSPRFGFNYGFKTELYSVPFPDLWKGFFCVCLIRPIFLKNILSNSNWSTLLSGLMASSILELAVGWTSSVECTQNVVNFYTSCQGRSTRSTTEWRFLWLNDWAITEGKRLSDHGGQCTFGVSEGVAPAPYSATRSRRAMHFRGIRGGSTGSLLCNAIPRLRRRKRKTKRFGFVPNKRWRFPIRVVHFQSYSIEGQSVSVLPASVSLPIKCLRALRG